MNPKSAKKNINEVVDNQNRVEQTTIDGDQKSKEPRKKLSTGTIWSIKITLITFLLACCVTFITEIASTKSNIIISILLLLFLIVIAIIFDAIGVAATSCDIAPLLSMASRKVQGAYYAVKLVKNAEKVSNICNDVIGDMAGIISGICTATIVLKIVSMSTGISEYALLISIFMSSIVSAVTVGGKAFFKSIAMKNSKEMMLFAGKILSVFSIKNKKKKNKCKTKT